MNELRDLIPKNKHDVGAAAAAVKLGYPAVEPILPDLLQWMQDGNWPVAMVLEPFLVSIGEPLAMHLRPILAGSDDTWKYHLVAGVIARAPGLALILRPELERLSTSPTSGEREEEVDEVATEVLSRQ